LSEKINPEDQDSNEPIKQASYAHFFISRDEYQNLFHTVEEINQKTSDLCGDMKVVKGFIEEQKEAKKQAYVKAGIFAGIISVIIGIISRVWGN